MSDYRPKYFRLGEFACRCGCGQGADRMDAGLLHKLDIARTLYDKPIFVASGFRCPAHNRAEGGAGNSAHLSGHAVDIACPDDAERYRLVNALLAAGFRRIGLGPGFIHADIDPNKNTGRVWLYPGAK